MPVRQHVLDAGDEVRLAELARADVTAMDRVLAQGCYNAGSLCQRSAARGFFQRTQLPSGTIRPLALWPRR